MAGKPWHVPVPVGFARRCGLSPAAREVLFAIAGAARTRPYCWIGNGAIAELTGFPLDRVKKALRELAAAGWIVRYEDTGRWGRRTLRLGFILLKRPDVDFNPVSGPTEAEIEATFGAMLRSRAATAKGRRFLGAGGISCPPK